MARLLVTLATRNNFIEVIGLVDHSHALTDSMDEGNIENIMSSLPVKHQNKTLIQITHMHDLVYVNQERNDD